MVTWNLLLFILPPAMLLAGALLLAWGWRGRRVGDHPHCRACGFDLVGLPAESLRCSECGAILSRAGAVRTGRHQRRAGWIWAGAAVLIPAMLWLGGVGWLAARGTAYRHYLPTSWLVREAQANHDLQSGGAFGELMARLTSGQMPPSTLNALLERILDLQKATADKREVRDGTVHLTMLDPRWRTFMETARAKGKLSPAQWQRYARQSIQFVWTMRPKVRRGDPLPLSLAALDISGGGQFEARYSLELDLDGKTVPVQVRHGPYTDTIFPSTATLHWQIDADDPVLAKLPEGPHTAKLFVRADIFVTGKGPIPLSGSTPSMSKRLELTLPWTLQSADEPTVRINPDPSLRGVIEKNLCVRELKISGTAERRRVMGQLEWNSWDPPPSALAYDVFLRAQGREWKLGQYDPSCLTSSHDIQICGGSCPGLDTPKVDVVLRPNPAEAAKTLNVFEIWGQEVAFRDVVLKQSP